MFCVLSSRCFLPWSGLSWKIVWISLVEVCENPDVCEVEEVWPRHMTEGWGWICCSSALKIACWLTHRGSQVRAPPGPEVPPFVCVCVCTCESVRQNQTPKKSNLKTCGTKIASFKLSSNLCNLEFHLQLAAGGSTGTPEQVSGGASNWPRCELACWWAFVLLFYFTGELSWRDWGFLVTGLQLLQD